MFDVPIAFAVAAGMVAAVNPCGFALLPAYLAFFVGTEDGERSGPGRALFVTGALTAGFVTTFGAIGLALSTVATGIESHLPKVTVAIGAAMVVLGCLLLSGRSLSLPLPRLQRGGRTRDFGSMFLFGVSYATASLSCTIGPFLVALTPTFRDAGVLSGLSAFVAYSIGMGSVVGAVTVLVALAGAGAARRIRQWTPIVNRGAGALLVLAGAYVAYYGLWEIRGAAGDPIVDTAQEIRDRLATWIDGLSVWWPIAVLAVTGAGVLLRRQRSRTRARSGTVSPGRSDLDGEGESA